MLIHHQSKWTNRSSQRSGHCIGSTSQYRHCAQHSINTDTQYVYIHLARLSPAVSHASVVVMLIHHQSKWTNRSSQRSGHCIGSTSQYRILCTTQYQYRHTICVHSFGTPLSCYITCFCYSNAYSSPKQVNKQEQTALWTLYRLYKPVSILCTTQYQYRHTVCVPSFGTPLTCCITCFCYSYAYSIPYQALLSTRAPNVCMQSVLGIAPQTARYGFYLICSGAYRLCNGNILLGIDVTPRHQLSNVGVSVYLWHSSCSSVVSCNYI